MKKSKKAFKNTVTFEIKDKTVIAKRVKIPSYSKVHSANKKKCKTDCLKLVCWIIIPLMAVILFVLDALSIYTFNTERLIVLGIGLLTILLPFFSEIKVKDFSIKRSKEKFKTDT